MILYKPVIAEVTEGAATDEKRDNKSADARCNSREVHWNYEGRIVGVHPGDSPSYTPHNAKEGETV